VGVATIALGAYIATVIVAITVLRRTVGEAMVLAFVVLCVFGGITGPGLAWAGIADAFTNPIVFAVVTFVFMAILFQMTGIIDRQVAILNSALGRIPGGAGYVATVASGVFGMISHGGSANAAAIGSVTIPWMKRSGWPPHVAATLIAGNSGLGHVIPPSPSLLLLLGMAAAAPVVSLRDAFLPLMLAAGWIMVYRLAVAYFFVRRYGISGVDQDSLIPFPQALREGWTTLAVFLGIVIPLVVTTGPVGSLLTARVGDAAMDAVDIVMWIPVLMLVITIVLGARRLPRRPLEVYRLFESCAPRYMNIGVTLVFAFAASAVLTDLGLGPELQRLLAGFSASPIVLLLVVGTVLIVVAAPLPATATTATLGGVAFTVLTHAGVGAVPAIAAILIFVSTEGASPPAGSAIYIASGQARVDPVTMFVPLITLYVVPFLGLGVLIGSGLLPVAF